MKKAIAMKCNKEQFESIREKLVGFDFKADPLMYVDDNNSYLTNNYNEEDVIGITLCNNDDGYNQRQYYEKWDENIFLDACGIEPTIYARDYEYFDRNVKRWVELTKKSSKTLLRIKPTLDYSKEIESLQDKAKENGMKAIITFEKI